MKVGDGEDNAHLFLRAKRVIASSLSFSPLTSSVKQRKHLTFCCPLLLILTCCLQRERTVYLYKSMGEKSNLGKRTSLGWEDWVLLFSVGLTVRITMIHVLAVGAGVREALEALGALEGLFAAVQTLMFSQVMLVLERSWTLHTFVGPLPWNIYQSPFCVCS